MHCVVVRLTLSLPNSLLVELLAIQIKLLKIVEQGPTIVLVSVRLDKQEADFILL
jgi:hypothetical protein